MYSRSSSGYGTITAVAMRTGDIAPLVTLKNALKNFASNVNSLNSVTTTTTVNAVPQPLPASFTTSLNNMVTSLNNVINTVNQISSTGAASSSLGLQGVMSALDTSVTAFKNGIPAPAPPFIPSTFFQSYNDFRTAAGAPSTSANTSQSPPLLGSCQAPRTATVSVKDCWNGTSYVTSLA